MSCRSGFVCGPDEEAPWAATDEMPAAAQTAMTKKWEHLEINLLIITLLLILSGGLLRGKQKLLPVYPLGRPYFNILVNGLSIV
jgi:hypothetical protein